MRDAFHTLTDWRRYSLFGVLQLRRFLVTTNSLETVVLSKQVCWEGWEELATSIKNKIKCEGFDGEVEVSTHTQRHTHTQTHTHTERERETPTAPDRPGVCRCIWLGVKT